MAALCKYCLGDTATPINEDCEYCKKGLDREDLIIICDLLVPIIRKLNIDMGIKTFYSEEGYYTDHGQTASYIVYEDTSKADYVFTELTTLIGSIGKITKSSKDKKRTTFYIKDFDDVYNFTEAKVNLFSSIMVKLRMIEHRASYMNSTYDEIKKV